MIRPIILASILVRNRDKYLLVQEKTNKVYSGVDTCAAGQWTIPHGKVEKGETIEAAAGREFLEETGGKTKIRRLGVVSFARCNRTVGLLCFIYQGRGFEKIQKRWTGEIKAVTWFTKKEIGRLEKEGRIRDRLPVLKIIGLMETGAEAGMVEWQLPAVSREALRRMTA